MTFKERITPDAEAAIRNHARYIAIDEQSPLNSARWLERVYAAAKSLEMWPRRCALAEEDKYRPFEIRKLSVDGFLLLLTVVDEFQTVWIIAARHGHRLPLPQRLPNDIPTELVSHST